jgi:non-homologous end joining protein Ku
MAEFARKGLTLAFGLISTQVRLTGAVEKDTTPRLNTLCVGAEKNAEHPPVAVKSGYTCSSCGPLADKAVLKKGRPSGDGYVVVEAEDISTARAESGAEYKKKIQFTAHPADAVLDNTAPNGTLYYLAPEGAGEAYSLLRDLIAKHPEISFVALYTVSSRVGMYVARVHDNAIVLEGRYREAEFKAAPEFDDAEVNEQLFTMAQDFLEGMVVDFDAKSYVDSYAEKIKAMLDMATPVAGLTSEAPATSAPVDLMAALQAEIASKKAAS